MDIKKRVEISKLIDIYGALLTKKQFNVVNDYYNYNLALSEIAENLNISRQAVRDALIKAEELLYFYEKKLGFINIYLSTFELLDNIVDSSSKDSHNSDSVLIQKALKLKTILEER